MNTNPPPAARTRSPAYPAIGLPEAVSTVRAVYHAIQHHLAPHEVVAQALDMKSGGSTLIGRLSALRKFGLLEQRSVGPDRPKSYRLTRLARDLALLPASSPEWLQAARDAAGRPAIYRELWEKFGPQFASSPAMANYLIKQRGFNLRSVSGMLEDFMATMDYAKISGAVEAPRPRGFGDSEDMGSASPAQPVEAWSTRDYAARRPLEFDYSERRAPTNPLVLGTADASIRGESAGGEYFSITLPGTRELRFACPMSEDEWDLVQSALKVWKSQIVGTASSP
jgi:hypothetical protein